MALAGQTGHDSPAALRAEFERLLAIVERDCDLDRMDKWEQSFMTGMRDNLDGSTEWVPTSKQLFKLRDIQGKY